MNATAERHNVYREIHKAIRAMLADLLRNAGRLDYADGAALTMFRNEMKQAFTFLEEHAQHENDFVAPLLRTCDPELTEHMFGEHGEQELELHEISSALDKIDPRSTNARVTGHALTVRLSRFIGELFQHMADEEEQIMTTLWKHYDDAVLLDAHQRLVASLPPDTVVQEMSWMFPAIAPHERVELLVGVHMTAPAAAFDFMRGIASGVLTSAEDAALNAGLEQAFAALAMAV